MAQAVGHAVAALNRDFVRRYPAEAAHTAARMPTAALVDWLDSLAPATAAHLWDQLPEVAAQQSLTEGGDHLVRLCLGGAEPVRAARILTRLADADQQRCLSLLGQAKRRELEALMAYPDDSAGALMDPQFITLHPSMTAHNVLQRLRRQRPHFTRQLFIVDEAGRLQSMLELHELALAPPRSRIADLARSVPAAVLPTAPRQELVEQIERAKVTDMPVVDMEGRLLGVVQHQALTEAVREETSVDLQTMVGASRDERALSSVSFVVRKRLPWLNINLLTAFLAASVVGLFESTIAQFTALAVLLPVVAGQSGNTGAQALAVTMRSLALREIGTSQWPAVVRKELAVGFFNGVAVALVTAIGVWLWSSSVGLALVIGSAMVISMMAACVAGVAIPMMLSALGQDPAQSSSIFLTTVTDILGFFTFLGLATLLAGFL